MPFLLTWLYETGFSAFMVIKSRATNTSTVERGRVAQEQHGLGSKSHSRHSVVSLGNTLYGTFPCLVVLASNFKFQSYLY